MLTGHPNARRHLSNLNKSGSSFRRDCTWHTAESVTRQQADTPVDNFGCAGAVVSDTWARLTGARQTP
jgi:hypothetical protein